MTSSIWRLVQISARLSSFVESDPECAARYAALIPPADTPVRMSGDSSGNACARWRRTPTWYAARAPPPVSTSVRSVRFSGMTTVYADEPVRSHSAVVSDSTQRVFCRARSSYSQRFENVRVSGWAASPNDSSRSPVFTTTSPPLPTRTTIEWSPAKCNGSPA